MLDLSHHQEAKLLSSQLISPSTTNSMLKYVQGKKLRVSKLQMKLSQLISFLIILPTSDHKLI